MKRQLKLFGLVLLALCVLILIVGGIIYFLAGTDSGFAKLSRLTDDHMDSLTLQNPSGNLIHGISADSFEYENKTVSVHAEGVSSAWRLSCLVKRRACMDELSLEKLEIVALDSADQQNRPKRTRPITLPEISLPINFSVSKLAVNELHYKSSEHAPAQVFHEVFLSAQTSGSTLDIQELSLQYKETDASLKGSVELTGDYDLLLSLDLKSPDILPDTVAGGSGEQPLQLSASFSDSLSNLTVNTQSTGVIDATLVGVVQPLQPDLPLTATFVSDAIGWPLQTQSQILASPVRIEVGGDLTDFRLSVETSIEGEQLPAAKVKLEALANSSRLNIYRADIDTLSGQLQGSLLAGLGEKVIWETQWSLAGIDPSVHFPEFKGSLNGDVNATGILQQGQWSLNLHRAFVSGELQGYPFSLDTKIAKRLDDAWHLKSMLLKNGANQISAQGVVDDHWNLQADINLAELENLLPDLTGTAQSELRIAGDLNQPDIDLSVESDSISFNDISVEGVALQAKIDQLFFHDSQLQLTIDKAEITDKKFGKSSLALTGNRANHQLEVVVNGPLDTALSLDLNGSLQDDLNWQGLLQSTTATLPDHEVSLADATELGWIHNKKEFYLDAHCWRSDDSSLCLENKVSTTSSGQAGVTLDQYSLQRLTPFFPAVESLAGSTSGDALISWGSDVDNGPQAVVEAMISQGSAQIPDAAGNLVNLEIESLDVAATLTSESIKSTITLVSEDLGEASVNVQLNPSDSQSPMQGDLNLENLQLSTLQTILPDFEQISGVISASGLLSGKPTAPKFDGSVTLADPELRAEMLPLPVTGGELTAAFKGQTLTLDGQLLSDEGSVLVEGSGSIKPEQWFVKARLQGEGLKIRTDPVQDSTVNHDITLSANQKSTDIRGSIEIPMAIIDVEELPEGAATVSGDVIIIEDEEKSVTESNGTASNLRVQLAINLGDDVNLSAYGLTARLEGDMDIRMRSPNPPQFGGEITVADGVYKQYGQDLQASGQVLFVGPVDNTRLAIDAVRQIDNENRTAGLKIQGTVATPEITLFTEPADKSQDAILSYIVLGRDINQASDQDANLLAAAALALTVKGSRSLAGGIASALGVQDFALDTKGTGDDTELVISGRLNDRLLLRYGRGVFGTQNTLYLRYDLTQKLYLEAAQGAEQAVDLFYSFSF